MHYLFILNPALVQIFSFRGHRKQEGVGDNISRLPPGTAGVSLKRIVCKCIDIIKYSLIMRNAKVAAILFCGHVCLCVFPVII